MEHLQHVKETCQSDSSVLFQFQQRREYFLSVYAGKVKQLEKNCSNIRTLYLWSFRNVQYISPWTRDYTTG